MAKIESPLGTRTESTPPMRTFTVEDNSDQQASTYSGQQVTVDELSELRKQKMNEMGTVSQTVRRRIEMLVGIGRAYRDIKVKTAHGQIIFTVRSLKVKEMKYLTQLAGEAAKVGELGSAFDIRSRTLACAITAIDGAEIDLVLDSVSLNSEDRLAVRVNFLNELDESVLAYLHSEYQKMVKTHSEQFSIKSDAEAKEVAEDIKKSG